MKNGERHSLARITLRWMIRECFEVDADMGGIGIIFDSHMLKNEVGLDIDPISKAPTPLPPGVLHLRKPNGAELEGFSLRHIPVAVISGLGSPFRWVRGKILNLRVHDSKKYRRTLEKFERNRPITQGEPREELNDALSPIVDQIKIHPGWNVIEWIPCKLSPLTSVAINSYTT